MGLICIFVLICIALLLICNKIVVNNAEGKVFSDIDSIKYNKVGLLLGTTPQARLTRFTNYFFIYRLDAAEQLYKAGKIGKILISGDENSLDGINEPECMRESECKAILLQAVAVIEDARQSVAMHVATIASNTHWNIGKLLHERIIESEHGSRVVERLSVDLKERYPKMGVSPTAMEHEEVLSPLRRQRWKTATGRSSFTVVS